jgi:hypothetical protein
MTTLLNRLSTGKGRFLGLSVLSLIMIASTAAIVIANADFKGEWAFNEQKSKLAEGRFRGAAQKLKVSQDGDALVIERTSTTPNGDVTSTDKLTFDGKTSESTVFGNNKKKSTAAWSSDGEAMTVNSTIVFERDGNTFEVKITEVRKLIDGGKGLSIENTSVSQRGTTTQTFVYDKK